MNQMETKSCIEFINDWKELIKQHHVNNERKYTITDITIKVNNRKLKLKEEIS